MAKNRLNNRSVQEPDKHTYRVLSNELPCRERHNVFRIMGDLPKAIEYCDIALKSPACTNPAQVTARRNFQERKKKLEARLMSKMEKEKRQTL